MADTLAKVIAEDLGYDWDTLYENKREWTADQGSRHDINVPYKTDFRAASKAVAERCALIAKNLTDDETRKALGANAVIVASQIERAIRALSHTEESANV